MGLCVCVCVCVRGEGSGCETLKPSRQSVVVFRFLAWRVLTLPITQAGLLQAVGRICAVGECHLRHWAQIRPADVSHKPYKPFNPGPKPYPEPLLVDRMMLLSVVSFCSLCLQPPASKAGPGLEGQEHEEHRMLSLFTGAAWGG